MQREGLPTYYTDHLYLAAYLTCSGHPVELSAAVANFMSGGTVPARQLSFQVLKLKRLIPRGPERMERYVKYTNEDELH
jgi:hypothetical protein